TVLVIEDEASSRAALTRMLTLRGISVIAVPTGSDALKLLQQKKLCADMVLCDYNLPGPMNGVESIQSLRTALSSDLPAIVMTGDTRAKTLEAIASHGVSTLVKPFLGDELVRLMNRVCRSSESSGHSRSAPPVAQRPTSAVSGA
ncbi:MAG: response regulator, partial [Sinobacteraceae bacterium]|nr:response regulator [Nevskiaceae bacterium]MBV9317827.1 response regulator [Gammaproteobacteria bacterium]